MLISPRNIPKGRQFIETCRAKKTERCDSVRIAFAFGPVIGTHGAHCRKPVERFAHLGQDVVVERISETGANAPQAQAP